MILRSYEGGRPKVHAQTFVHSGMCIEVVLDDERTVQLIVREDGHIDLRAWGNEPAKLGNGNSVSFHCPLPYEEQTHDPITYERLPGPPPDKDAISRVLDALGTKP